MNNSGSSASPALQYIKPMWIIMWVIGLTILKWMWVVKHMPDDPQYVFYDINACYSYLIILYIRHCITFYCYLLLHLFYINENGAYCHVWWATSLFSHWESLSSGFKGRILKPGRPGGKLPLSMFTVYNPKQHKPHKKAPQRFNRFRQIWKKNAEKHNDNS